MQLIVSLGILIPAAAHSHFALSKFSLKSFKDKILLIQPPLEALETLMPYARAMFKRLSQLIIAGADELTQPGGQTFFFLMKLSFLGNLKDFDNFWSYPAQKELLYF
jgi:hypothetical protein